MSVHSESADLAAEALELVIDAQLEEGIAKDIPLLSSALGLVRLKQTIVDYLFAKKVRVLLLHAEQVVSADREEFRERMIRDSDYATKVGECVVFTCQLLDSTAKAEMLGLAFASHLRKQIDLDLFRRFATAINAGFIDDLLHLALSGSAPGSLVNDYMFRLTHTGLTCPTAGLNESPFGTSVKNDCYLTETGRAFLKIIGPQYEKRRHEFAHLPRA